VTRADDAHCTQIFVLVRSAQVDGFSVRVLEDYGGTLNVSVFLSAIALSSATRTLSPRLLSPP
jgi:hypothetical protein